MTSIPTSINRVLPVTPKNDASFSNSQGGTVTVQTNTAHTSSGHNAAAVQESSRNNNLSSPVFSDSTTRYRIVVVEERDTDCPDIEQQAKFTDFPQPEECCSHVSQSLVLK